MVQQPVRLHPLVRVLLHQVLDEVLSQRAHARRVLDSVLIHLSLHLTYVHDSLHHHLTLLVLERDLPGQQLIG